MMQVSSVSDKLPAVQGERGGPDGPNCIGMKYFHYPFLGGHILFELEEIEIKTLVFLPS